MSRVARTSAAPLIVPKLPRVPSLAAFGRRPRCQPPRPQWGRRPKPITKPAICTAARILLDHIVGGGEERWRNREVDRSRGLQVDDEFEFGRLHHRHFGRLLTLEDAPGIDPNLAILVQNVG